MIDKAVDRYRKGKRTLVAAAERYGVDLDDAHDAAADAIAAGRVAQAIARAFPDEVDVPFADLHGRQQIWYAEQAASFQQYIREVKGDETYVAESAWPLRPLDDPMMFEDTMPLPVPKPRPSATVPTFDFGPLALGSSGSPRSRAVPLEIRRRSAAARRGRAHAHRRDDHGRGVRRARRRSRLELSGRVEPIDPRPTIPRS